MKLWSSKECKQYSEISATIMCYGNMVINPEGTAKDSGDFLPTFIIDKDFPLFTMGLCPDKLLSWKYTTSKIHLIP